MLFSNKLQHQMCQHVTVLSNVVIEDTKILRRIVIRIHEELHKKNKLKQFF